MKDFSLWHSPARAWLPVIAIAALGILLFLNQASSDGEACDAGVAICAEAEPGRGQLLSDDSAPGLGPVSAEVRTSVGVAGGDGAAADGDSSAWERNTRSGAEVPFVSLEPSPEPMTEAGEDLVRSLADDE